MYPPQELRKIVMARSNAIIEKTDKQKTGRQQEGKTGKEKEGKNANPWIGNYYGGGTCSRNMMIDYAHQGLPPICKSKTQRQRELRKAGKKKGGKKGNP